MLVDAAPVADAIKKSKIVLKVLNPNLKKNKQKIKEKQVYVPRNGRCGRPGNEPG